LPTNQEQAKIRKDLLEQDTSGQIIFGGARMALLDLEAGFYSLRQQIEGLAGKSLADAVIQQAGAQGGASFSSSYIKSFDNYDIPTLFRECLASYQAAGFGEFEIETLDWENHRIRVRAVNAFEAWIINRKGETSENPVCAYTAGVLVGFLNVLDSEHDLVCIEHVCQAQGSEGCLFELLPAKDAGQFPAVMYTPDPSLGSQLNLLEILFDRMPMGIAIFDNNFNLKRCNPTWASMLERYTLSKASHAISGANFFDLAPGSEATTLPVFDRVLRGETVSLEAVPVESSGIVSYWDVTFSPLKENEKVVGFVDVTIDATERVRSNQALQENEKNLHSLLETAQKFAIYRIEVALDQPRFGRVTMVSPSLAEILGITNLYDFESWFENIHPDDIERVEAANYRALTKGVPYNEYVRFYNKVKKDWIWTHTLSNPVFDDPGRLTHFNGLVVDVSEGKLAEEAFQESQRRLSTLMSNMPGMAYRCFQNCDMEFVSEGSLELTGYPPEILVGTENISYDQLIHPDDRNTVMADKQDALTTKQPYRLTYRIRTANEAEKWVWEQGRGVYSKDNELQAMEGFITDITDRVNNQRLLEQRVEERTQDLFTVLEVSHTVASTLDLQPLMKLILEQLKAVVNFDGASVMVLDGEQLRILAYQGPIPQKQALEIKFPLDKAEVNSLVIHKREPIIVPDVFADTYLAQAIRKTAGEELETTFSYMKSWMGVPLIVRDQAIGMISLDHHERNYFQPPQDKLMMAFANQVAVAIENARLYANIRQRADETQTLLAVQKAITSRLDTKAVLQMIADEALRLTGTEQSAVYLLEGDELVISVISGGVKSEMLGYRLPVDGSVAGQAITTGKPFLVSDAEKDHRVHADIIQKVGAKTFVIVPLLTSNGPIGTITVANKQERPLGAEDEWVLTMLASGAVVALENARLYNDEQEQRRQAEQRRQIAEGLRDIVKLLNSDRSLEEILDSIVSQASQLLGSKAVVIFKINDERDSMLIEAAYNMPDTFMDIGEMPLIQSEPNQAILNKQPFPVENLEARIERFSHLLPHLPESIRDFYNSVRGVYNAELSVPLIIRDEVYGAISLFYVEPRQYSEEDIALAVSFADQAALAIENTRLRSQAARIAVQSERSRLARDLHDAVTQTLFSASLIAEVMPRLWDKNREEGIRRLGELRELTRGALAEMRTLLLELRPSALIEAEPAELFRHLVEAFTGRARVPIDFQIKGEGDLPPDIKVAFYRIAQEALNNIAKHAEASQVTLNVECEEDRLSLLIKDNGQGFDMGEISHESLGLGIMRERADNIGAILSIYSEVGEGTQISVSWKKPER
jgi:PAS domain S-box-containing protein